jgi:hypothetical protein
MTARSAVFIEVRFSDGSISRAEGKPATDIWKWMMAAEAMYCIHGAAYTGEKLTEIPAAEVPND